MQTWIDYQQALVASRTHDLATEAAANRLAKLPTSPMRPRSRVRILLGAALIRAGEALAPEPTTRRSTHGRPHAA